MTTPYRTPGERDEALPSVSALKVSDELRAKNARNAPLRFASDKERSEWIEFVRSYIRSGRKDSDNAVTLADRWIRAARERSE